MKKFFRYLLLAMPVLFSCNKGEKPEPSPAPAGDSAVTEISLSDEFVPLSVGKTYLLQAIVLPEDAKNKSVLWASSDEGVAKVSSGLVTAVGDGDATITATPLGNLNLSATCRVEVRTIYVESISVAENALTMVVDADLQLEPVILPENAENAAIGYEVTSGAGVVSVTDGGLVHAEKVGQATVRIYAKDGHGAATNIGITVQAEPIYASSFTIDCDEEVQAGKTLTAKINWSPAGTNQKGFSVNSTNTSVATVSGSSGNTFTINALKEGTTTISVHYTSKAGVSDKSFTLYVHSGAPSIAWSCDWKTSYGSLDDGMVPGESYDCKAGVVNLNNGSITYSTGNPAVATVNASTGKLTAVGEGETTITATSQANSSLKVTRTVKVWPAPTQIYSPAGEHIFVKAGATVSFNVYVRDSRGANTRQTLIEEDSMGDFKITTENFANDGSGKKCVKFTIKSITSSRSYTVQGDMKFRIPLVSGYLSTVLKLYSCQFDESDVKPYDAIVAGSTGALAVYDSGLRGWSSDKKTAYFANGSGPYTGTNQKNATAFVFWTGTPGVNSSALQKLNLPGIVKGGKTYHGYAVAANDAFANTGDSERARFQNTANDISDRTSFKNACSVTAAATGRYGYDITQGMIAYNTDRGPGYTVHPVQHLYRAGNADSRNAGGYGYYEENKPLKPENGKSSGWFVPTQSEWRLFMGLESDSQSTTSWRTHFNKLFSVAGGAEMLTTLNYWTCQQGSTSNKAVSVTGAGSINSVDKTSFTARTRAFMAF